MKGFTTLFVYALCTYEKNHEAVNTSLHTWRSAPSYVSTSGQIGLNPPFVYQPDDHLHGWQDRGGTPAETRCTDTVRNAFVQYPDAAFVITGDDDVLWIESAVYALLNKLDPTVPLHLTDGFLDGQWLACEGVGSTQCLASTFGLGPLQPGTVYNTTHKDMWAYGNYGAIWSRGLFEAITTEQFDSCAYCNSTSFTCMFGYDVRLGECAWAFGNTAPTTPYEGSVAAGRTFGVPYESYVKHLRDAVGDSCDASCEFLVHNAVSVTIPKNLFHDKDLYRSTILQIVEWRGAAMMFLQIDKKSPFYYNSNDNAFNLKDRHVGFIENYEKCLGGQTTSELYGAFLPQTQKIEEKNKAFQIIRVEYDDFKPFFDDNALQILNRHSHSILLAFNNEKVHITKGYFYLIDQWFKHLQRLQLDKYVVFAAPSEQECELVLHMGPCILHDAAETEFRYDSSCDTCLPLAADFRWLYVNALLDAGKEIVILSDADAFFLKDPFPLFRESESIVFGLSDRDYNYTSDLGYCETSDASCISTGFVAFKSDASSMVDEFVEILYSEGGWEQEIFNEFFPQFEDVEELPFYSITNAFANLQNVIDIVRGGQDAINLAVVHAGSIHGDDKIKKMQCAQLWL